MRFKTGEVIAEQPTWWLYGVDGALVAWAGGTFATSDGAAAAAERFRFQAAHARYEQVQDRPGRWRWRARVDQQVVASSSEVFASELEARRASQQVRTGTAHAAPVHGRPTALRRTAD